MAMTAKKIISGLNDAERRAETLIAVHAWIREDLPIAAKMAVTPDHVTALIDRICGSTTTKRKG